ncbi:exodeoxyribonuclease V subunit beta, partial [Mycolicibacterium elephantis]
KEWEAAGGLVVEESVRRPIKPLPRDQVPETLAARHFHRSIDTSWRRTSYSGLIRAAEATPVSSEPEVGELDDEVAEIPLVTSPVGSDVPSPMADLPSGAKFGTLVHAVLETADPFAPDLAAELEARIVEHSVWWPVDVAADE